MVQRHSQVSFVKQRNMVPFIVFVMFVLFLVAVTIYQSQCGGVSDTRKTGVPPKATTATHEPPRYPEITMTEVSPGVFHIDFDGYFCIDATCMKRSFGLVHEQAPRSRVVDVEPIGEYGYPTAFIVVTAPVP